MGEAEIHDKFGCRPDQVVEIQALAGDSSDNVPGVQGIGIKTAALLLEEHGTLEGILAAANAVDDKGKPVIKQNKRRERLQEQAEMARISAPRLPEMWVISYSRRQCHSTSRAFWPKSRGAQTWWIRASVACEA